MNNSFANFEGQVVPVDLGPRSYPIYIGQNGYDHFGQTFDHHCGRQRAIIISDGNVAPLYADQLTVSLRASGIESHLLVVEPGETSKTMAVLESVYDRLFDVQAERRDTIVALGGGVVGDLAGYAAASFKRGLNYVQAPTSLLAMVDSSIGGKTGINHPRGKNMIGAFHQPRMVFADVSSLKTLPRRELGCGLAESIKHAVIRDEAFFTFLTEKRSAILDLDLSTLVELVAWNCRIKAAVVAADERESGLRGILNFGHTVGHVFETVKFGQDYHHGEAVSLGMIAASRLAVQRGLMTAEQAQAIRALLEAYELPTSISQPLPIDDLYRAMLQDKKVRDGKIVFALPKSIGDCTFVDDVDETAVRDAIAVLQKP